MVSCDTQNGDWEINDKQLNAETESYFFGIFIFICYFYITIIYARVVICVRIFILYIC